MYMLTIEKPPEGTPLRLPREGLAATYRERLAPASAARWPSMRELIVDDDAVVYRPVENVVVPAPWYRDNVVLIGDAAHATSPHCGQGAAQAIEDALVLTEELQRARRRSAPRSTRSWTRRFERCRFIVEGSEAIGAWEMDHSLPIDPNAKRTEVTMAAMAPI